MDRQKVTETEMKRKMGKAIEINRDRDGDKQRQTYSGKESRSNHGGNDDGEKYELERREKREERREKREERKVERKRERAHE